MPGLSRAVFEPRKSPVQARSAASVQAILDATIQVLLAAGKERLTTTSVALRAGVSVGTLYQYFPNKSALLQAVLKRHLDAVAEAVERVGREQRGATLESMAEALITAFFAAKMESPRTSAALYAVSSDVDGLRIAKEMAERTEAAITAMLDSAPVRLASESRLVATVLFGAMAGVSRHLLQAKSPEKSLGALRGELINFAGAYLQASAMPQRSADPAGALR